MATQKLFSVTVMFKEEDFPFENKKKGNVLSRDGVRRF